MGELTNGNIIIDSMRDSLGDKKNGGFLKQILSTSIQEKLIKIGDGWKALRKIFNLSCVRNF